MSFAIKIKKDHQNALKEVAGFAVWQKQTFNDDTFSVEKIDVHVQLLQDSVSKAQGSYLILKKKDLDYKLYQLLLTNENGTEKENKLPDELYFQVEPNFSGSIKYGSIKKIEFSLEENFTTRIYNEIFYRNFTFRKETDLPFEFYVLNGHNQKLYQKTLIPFPVNPPLNDHFMVYNSLEFYDLKGGFYTIDGQQYFYDAHQEIKHNHYIIKVLI